MLFVGLAVLAFSTSPIFIAWADPMPALFKTWTRLFVAAIAVGVLALLTARRAASTEEGKAAGTQLAGRSTRNVVSRFAFYGLVAALHFTFYVASLDYTTTAHALALVYTAPIFVTLLAALILKETIKNSQWVGVIIAVMGIAILAGLEPLMTPTMAFGDLLAVGSAITFGVYTIAGRYERDHTPLLVYASRVYASAALWLLPVAIAVAPGAPAEAWGGDKIASAVALGLIPLALGHTLYNASLRRLHPTVANIIASQEVTCGILLSLVLLGQLPSTTTIVGALVTLVGIVIVLK